MMHKKVRKRLFELTIFTRSQKIALFFQILKKLSKARIKALYILLELCKQQSEVKYFFQPFDSGNRYLQCCIIVFFEENFYFDCQNLIE